MTLKKNKCSLNEINQYLLPWGKINKDTMAEALPDTTNLHNIPPQKNMPVSIQIKTGM
jgi:hypothetical protein